jgi:uncharacterized protein YjbI with pentapeptide repeats
MGGDTTIPGDDGQVPGAAEPKPLWRPVALTAAGAAVILVAGTIGLTWLLTRQWVWDYRPPDPATDPAAGEPDFGLPGALRASLLIVGGLGGIVALVVAYRRQKHLEADAAGKREAARDEVAKEQAQLAAARESARDATAQRAAADAAERERVRLFTERFGAASTQLGSGSAVTRLAGVYAMAALANEWMPQQQQCIDVLCAYLRLPYTPEDAPTDTPVRTTTTRTRTGRGQEHRQETTTESRPGEREVRWTIIRVIRDHLVSHAGDGPWVGRNFDFTGATFDGAEFTGAKFSGGMVSFTGAKFTGAVSFFGATFSPGGLVTFTQAEFSGGVVDFTKAKFTGAVIFTGAKFSGGVVTFDFAEFSGGYVQVGGSEYFDTDLTFRHAKFSDGTVQLMALRFSGGTVSFHGARFSGGTVDLRWARFSDWTVNFGKAEFAGTEFIWLDGSEHDRPPAVWLADDAEVGPPAGGGGADGGGGVEGGGFGGESGEGGGDVGGDVAEGDAEDGLAAFDEVDDLFVVGGEVDPGGVGEQGESGEVAGVVVVQGVQGGADVGQGDTGGQ